MAGAYPTVGSLGRSQEETFEAAVVRDPWRWWRLGMALPPVGPLVYPFPWVPPLHDEFARLGWYRPEESFMRMQARRQPVGEPTFGYEPWLGSGYVRPQIPEEALARPAVEPGGYTVDELLGGNVRRTGMNSNVPAAGK
jgi:hypothetical protein